MSKAFRWMILGMGLVVLTSGCMTVDILCDNKIGSGNNILASRSVAADRSVADLTMKGNDSTTVNAQIPILKEGPGADDNGSLRVFCGNELVTENNIGTVRSLTASKSNIKQKMEGGDTNNVTAVIDTPLAK